MIYTISSHQSLLQETAESHCSDIIDNYVVFMLEKMETVLQAIIQ